MMATKKYDGDTHGNADKYDDGDGDAFGDYDGTRNGDDDRYEFLLLCSTLLALVRSVFVGLDDD